jgi:hypothetical protein
MRRLSDEFKGAATTAGVEIGMAGDVVNRGMLCKG